MTVVMDEFKDTRTMISADDRGRITLGATEKEKTYCISRNDAGQILFTPVVAVPEYELWLWRNPAALASVQKGLEEAASDLGQAIDFSQYADIDTED